MLSDICWHNYNKLADVRLHTHHLLTAPYMQPCCLKQAHVCRRASLQSAGICTACRPLSYISSTQTVSWYRPVSSCHHSPIAHQVHPVPRNHQINTSLCHAVFLLVRKKRKEKFTLFSDHNGSLLRWQPGAMTIGHRTHAVFSWLHTLKVWETRPSLKLLS